MEWVWVAPLLVSTAATTPASVTAVVWGRKDSVVDLFSFYSKSIIWILKTSLLWALFSIGM